MLQREEERQPHRRTRGSASVETQQIPVTTTKWTMEALRIAIYLSICLSVLTTFCQGQRSLDQPLIGMNTQQLADALQNLLDEDDGVGLSVEKKASVIPRCDVGERCAMKHGPRIGRLCDCLRGTACNTFFLRCY
ncbi:cocaine- and amphetamine-regulated transcript 4 [Synchiropus splendidus]|uniref:cocaine- and amphetamine-regulated transcript 4 n=1 Tax=Synchiropus splendidus TaxID=270530 RepID=UPI00237E113C|nr:cocaine- and amphetamine-regulated transcript 4 [Synchiropus splendidus]